MIAVAKAPAVPEGWTHVSYGTRGFYRGPSRTVLDETYFLQVEPSLGGKWRALLISTSWDRATVDLGLYASADAARAHAERAWPRYAAHKLWQRRRNIALVLIGSAALWGGVIWLFTR